MKKNLLILIFACISSAQAQVQINASGGFDNFIVNYPAAIVTAPDPGMEITFLSNQNITGSAKLNLNGTGPKIIYKNYDQLLQTNDIKIGHFVRVIYDASGGGKWQMLSSSANPSGANFWSIAGTNLRPIANNQSIQVPSITGAYMIGSNTGLRMNENNSVFIGNQAGNTTTTGSDNIFYGIQSGLNNTSGYQNIFNGYQSGFNNSTGNNNIFNGFQSGYYNTAGNNNIFIGYYSGVGNTTGSGNIFNGYNSGSINTIGNNNIAIGNGADFAANNYTNAIAIGISTIATGSNQAIIGNAITGLGINVAPTAMLDVNGDARIRNLSTSGAVFADNTGKLFVSAGSGANPWTVNGTNIFQQNLSYKVGIGLVPNASGQLQISDPANSAGQFRLFAGPTGTGETGSDGFLLNINGGTGDVSLQNYEATGRLTLGSGGSSIRATMLPSGFLGLKDFTSTPANRLSVDGSVSIGTNYYATVAPTNGLIVEGNVGIGTSSPSTKLDVVGDVKIGNGLNSSNFGNDGSLIMTGSANYKVGYGKNIFEYSGNNSLKMTLEISGGYCFWQANNPVKLLSIDQFNGETRILNLSTSGVIFADNTGKLFTSTSSGANAWTINGTNVQTTNNTHNVNIITSSGAYMINNIPAIRSNPNSVFLGNSTGLLGDNNLFFGVNSGNTISTGANNVFLGLNSGKNFSTGGNNISIGNGAGSSVGTFSNTITLGQGASANSNGQMIISTNITGVGLNTGTPKNLLDVKGSVAIGATYAGVSNAPINGLIVEGNVGIGTNNPFTALDVRGTTALNESVFRFGIQDSPNDHITLWNGIGTAAMFQPLFETNVESNSFNGMTFRTQLLPGVDVGGSPVTNFDVKRNNSAPISTRPLFAWSNNGNNELLMDASGDLRTINNNIYFKNPGDFNHGIGWYGTGKLFNSVNIDGPVLFGYGGGALGLMDNASSLSNAALTWVRNGTTNGANVGIGTTVPGTALDVNGALSLRASLTNTALVGAGTIPITANPSYSYIKITAAGAITLNATTSIADGLVIGQILILENIGASNIIINDATNVQLNGGAAYTIGAADTLMVIWNGTDWIEISRINN